MKNKKLIVCFIALIVVFASVFIFTRQQGNQDNKTITFSVVSTLDDVSDVKEYTTNCEFLSEFIIENELAVYEDSMYGMYIREVQGIKDSTEEMLWWAILVDGEMATTGANEIVLEEGSIYTLELMQGY